VQLANIPTFQSKDQEEKYLPEQDIFIWWDRESCIPCIQYLTGHSIVSTSLGSKIRKTTGLGKFFLILERFLPVTGRNIKTSGFPLAF